MNHDCWDPGQETIFDQLWLQLRGGVQRLVRPLRGHGWPLMMLGMALVFSGIGVYFLLQLLLPVGIGGAATTGAPLGGLLLALAVARHFVFLALQTLSLGTLTQQPVWANNFLCVLVGAVVLPVSLFVAFRAHPLCGLLLFLAYALAAGCLRSQGAALLALCPAPGTPARHKRRRSAVSMVAIASPESVAAERRSVLANARLAGINVRSAAALVKAGYVSVEALCSARDEHILTIKGVGPATLRKIRVFYPFRASS